MPILLQKTTILTEAPISSCKPMKNVLSAAKEREMLIANKLQGVYFLALDSRGCGAQGRGQTWVDLECHDVSNFTKAL